MGPGSSVCVHHFCDRVIKEKHGTQDGFSMLWKGGVDIQWEIRL